MLRPTATVTAFGLAGGLLGRSTGLVENCAAVATLTTLKLGTGTAAGGLAGADVEGTMRFCFANSPGITSARAAGLVGYCSPTSTLINCVSNKVAARAVENWTADVVGSAWCEDASVLASRDFFTGLGWDLNAVWYLDLNGALRLRWMNGNPTAVITGPSVEVAPDPATGLANIALDGSQSSDPDKNPLKYAWTCLKATGEATGITISPVVNPLILLPAGAYRIELIVNNGLVDSTPAVIVITVNAAPTAVIREPSGMIRCDATTGLAKVVLDGSPSSDPDNDALTYNWKCLTLSGGATGVAISPVAQPLVSLQAGAYRIELTVNDGGGDSVPFAISLTVGVPNTPPTAVIKGPLGAVRPDPATGLAKIVLDGSQSSDPDKDVLKYVWKCLTATGGATEITMGAVVNPSVSLRAGTYRIELTVNDGLADSAPVFIVVTIIANTAPKAVIVGPSGVVRPDPTTGLAKVALDGSRSSDTENDTLKYTWKCLTVSGEATGITIDAVVNPSVSLCAGVYKIELTVNDGVADSAPSAVVVTINTPPIAKVAGPYELFDEGTGKRQVKLDGSKSSDAEAGKGQTLVYSWSCATAHPSTALGPTTSLEFPVGVHTVQLVVSDGVESAQATTQVVVRAAVTAARVAASPNTVGRTSVVADVEFYLLMPAGRSVDDLDSQAPIILDVTTAKIQLRRDSTYAHKRYTVAAVGDRKKVLDALGAANGIKPVILSIRCRTGEVVFGVINLELVAGPGPGLAEVQAERAWYYLDTRTWK